jgi:hypothetical protein
MHEFPVLVGHFEALNPYDLNGGLAFRFPYRVTDGFFLEELS